MYNVSVHQNKISYKFNTNKIFKFPLDGLTQCWLLWCKRNKKEAHYPQNSHVCITMWNQQRFYKYHNNSHLTNPPICKSLLLINPPNWMNMIIPYLQWGHQAWRSLSATLAQRQWCRCDLFFETSWRQSGCLCRKMCPGHGYKRIEIQRSDMYYKMYYKWVTCWSKRVVAMAI